MHLVAMTRIAITRAVSSRHCHIGGFCRMPRWLACTVLAAFILGDPARAGLGIEVGAFVLAPGTARQSVSTNGMPGSPNYAVPLFDISGYTSGGAPGQSVYVLTGPFPHGPGVRGLMQRTISARMLGAELIGVQRLHEDRRGKVEALVGYHCRREDLTSCRCYGFRITVAGVILFLATFCPFPPCPRLCPGRLSGSIRYTAPGLAVS